MKLGTDFSGIGSPEMALKYLGIDFKSVFACEIDKYARQTFKQLHEPQTFYNDITTRNHKEVEQLDLLVFLVNLSQLLVNVKALRKQEEHYFLM